MNNRLFLYSGFFLVMILLYDAWQNQNTGNSIVESNIPETVVESDRPSTRSFSEPDENVSSIYEATDLVNPFETIVVYTDTLEIKISDHPATMTIITITPYHALSLIHI